MDLFSASERFMRMDEKAWRRHANPWSVWTRIPIGPLLILAIFARTWIGWWCLIPILALLGWTWLNPRFFKAPEKLDSWASRGVMGERRLLSRRNSPIPDHHLKAAYITTAISIAGIPFVLYGLTVLNGWATAFGTALVVLGKLWFVDRMAWLHDEAGTENRTAPTS